MSAGAEKFKGVTIPPIKARPSRVKMTQDEMIQFNLEHARKFMEGDIDGIMRESIVDDPVWEFYPNRIRVSGKQAIRRYHEINYKAIIAQVDPRNGGDTREFYSETHGENVITHEFSNIMNLDGVEKRCYFIAVIPYQDGKMVGERVYMDKDVAVWFEKQFDADFFKLPGVERF